MTTDTVTLPRRAHGEPDHSPETPRRPAPIPTVEGPTVEGPTVESPTAPRLAQRGAWGLLRKLVSDDRQRPAADHLLLLGPSGGQIWASRLQ
jgi:hypothetical protein